MTKFEKADWCNNESRRRTKAALVKKLLKEPGLANLGENPLLGDVERAAEQLMKVIEADPVYVNDTYQVNVHNDGKSDLVHLSIKRRDKQPIRNWRDLQQIKNELVGPECEGVEVFPAESRRVDAANQYHLFVVKDPTYRFPFGFKERLVSDEPFGDAKQEPLPKEGSAQ